MPKVPEKKKASGCLAEQPGGPTTTQITSSRTNSIYFKEVCQPTFTSFTSAIEVVNTYFNLSARVWSGEGRER